VSVITKRSLLTRSCQWLSTSSEVCASTLDLFDLEDWLGSTKITAVRSDDLEDLEGVVKTVSTVQVGLLDLVIEEPLVDLNPGKASFSDGLLFQVFRKLTVILFEDADEDCYLGVGLPPPVVVVYTVRRALHLVMGGPVPVLLPASFA